ncbi:unnamed protein product, partial [Ectocarpus sp. 12 AP-2014]
AAAVAGGKKVQRTATASISVPLVHRSDSKTEGGESENTENRFSAAVWYCMLRPTRLAAPAAVGHQQSSIRCCRGGARWRRGTRLCGMSWC